MSLGLAITLANEWEQRVNEYAAAHEGHCDLSNIHAYIENEAYESGAPINGIWNKHDVANKVCEILAERTGFGWKFILPEKLI